MNEQQAAQMLQLLRDIKRLLENKNSSLFDNLAERVKTYVTIQTSRRNKEKERKEKDREEEANRNSLQPSTTEPRRRSVAPRKVR